MPKKIPALNAKSIRAAEIFLSAADPVMAELIARQSGRGLQSRKPEPPFHALTVSIINQQLSMKVADVIERRVAQLVSPPFSAKAMARVPPQKLRAAGLSGRKAQYLGELARRVLSGAIPVDEFPYMQDEEVMESLVAAPGIGRWTAEMFLMFALGRPDVISPGDAALCRAARRLYGRRFRGDDAEVLLKAGKKWRPHRTVACWHLWRSLRD